MALPSLKATYSRQSSDPAVMVADGQNVTVTVRNNQLTVKDGCAIQRRTRIISRAPKTISRLIILGHIGYITFEAFRFCAQEGIAVTQIDHDSNIIAMSPGMTNNVQLRQSQILASITGTSSLTALRIAQRLITAKLEGQSAIARDILNRPDVAARINAQAQYITSATTVDGVLGYEGVGASVYWSAWQKTVTVPFSPTDMTKVPAHWLSFHERASHPGAIDPINACLNYLYKFAETEARHACAINGIDPSIGFMHALRDGRDGMALDLMEVARPTCDRIILSLFDCGNGISYDAKGKPRYFPANCMHEIQHGVTRLRAPLTHTLAEHSLELAEIIAPVIADIVRILQSSDVSTVGSHQRSASVTHVRRYAPPRKSGRPLASTSMPVPACAADVIPDEAWRIISKHIPVKVNDRGGAKRLDDRVVIAGLVWCAANNLPTTRVPDSLQVSGHTIYQRRKRWIESGAWQHIEHAIRRTVLAGYTG